MITQISRKQLFCVTHVRVTEQKLHHKPLPVFPVGYPGNKIDVPSVPNIVHKHLTPGLLAGRLPGHQRGHWPKGFMFMRFFPEILV